MAGLGQNEADLALMVRLVANQVAEEGRMLVVGRARGEGGRQDPVNTMISPAFRIEEFLAAMMEPWGKSYGEILRAARAEVAEAERRSARGVPGSVKARARGSERYAEQLRGLIFLLSTGHRPANLEDWEVQAFRPVIQELVKWGRMKPEVMQVFDHTSPQSDIVGGGQEPAVSKKTRCITVYVTDDAQRRRPLAVVYPDGRIEGTDDRDLIQTIRDALEDDQVAVDPPPGGGYPIRGPATAWWGLPEWDIVFAWLVMAGLQERGLRGWPSGYSVPDGCHDTWNWPYASHPAQRPW